MVAYRGQNFVDAAKILLKSQGRPALGFNVPGHARGHAMVSSVEMTFLDAEESVETYSKNSTKTAFTTRSCQDVCLRYCLCSEEVRMAMERLNDGSMSETVTIDITPLDMEMVTYVDGLFAGWTEAQRAVLVLRHQEFDDDAHVHTFYPVETASDASQSPSPLFSFPSSTPLPYSSPSSSPSSSLSPSTS